MTRQEYRTAYMRILEAKFRPRGDILAAVVDPPEGTIGVHIRRGDTYRKLRRRLAGCCSHIPNFRARLTALLDADDSRKIFVASDDERAKNKFRRIWGDRVVAYPDVVQERDSPAGVKHALRDLYTLGRCDMILTDGNSTFGHVAARFQNRPIENMRKDYGTHGPFRRLLIRAADLLVDRPLSHIHEGVRSVAGQKDRN